MPAHDEYSPCAGNILSLAFKLYYIIPTLFCVLFKKTRTDKLAFLPL